MNVDLRVSVHHFVNRGRIQRSGAPSLLANLERGLPFPDKSASRVYSNNFLEHLSRDAALSCLRETHRVLAAGGIVRVVVPDLERYVRAYANRESEFFARVSDNTYWPSWCKLPADYLTSIVHGAPELGWVHRWAWDEETLTQALRSVGFEDVARRSVNESPSEDLRGIDGDLTAALALEAVK